MKIRTDFVTNSSSSNNAEVVIDNLVLLEILQRYKEMGVFGEADINFAIGIYRRSWSGGWSVRDFKSEILTPAFYIIEDNSGEGCSSCDDVPKTLDDVLTNIIDIMENVCNQSYYYEEKLFDQMVQELYEKEVEIKNGFKKVFYYYHYDDRNYLEEGDEYKWVFTYDPKNGEDYKVELYQWDDEEDDF